MSQLALGLDFGTESVRAVLVEHQTGAVAGTAESSYPHGVIDRELPGSKRRLPPEWALQSSDDWLVAMEKAVRDAIADAAASAEKVIGIGIDFTACTVLPTTANGTALHAVERFTDVAHAWPKLWKHHGAQPQADRVNALAHQRREPWLARYGGKISSEWLIPKALEVFEAAPEVYMAADQIVEGGDWVAWQLTGHLARNACAAGYKGTWHKRDGYPTPDFLRGLHPGFGELYLKKVRGPVVAPGTVVGGLTDAWAKRLGLASGTPVAAPIIDAHAATIGAGVTSPGTLFIMMGTSSCHLLLAHSEVLVEGQSGVVEDGIVPGLFGYEAGQAAVGDIFAWFGRNAVSAALHQEAERIGRPLNDVLSDRAAQLRPGESGLLALDWWNGCRTPLVDADLGGVIVGFNLQTTPAAIYRALIEATAFGTRLIIQVLVEAGLSIDRVRVAGGLTRNELLMQTYADITGEPFEVCSTLQASAIGAAILGAVAGSRAPDVGSAARAMAQPPGRTFFPNPHYRAIYDSLYSEYRRLVDLFGHDRGSTLKRLLTLRLDATTAGDPLTGGGAVGLATHASE